MLAAKKQRNARQMIDGLIAEWAEDVVQSIHKTGFYGINVVERILRDPGKSSGGSQHRVLWWPRNKRVAMMSRVVHQIDPISQICLLVRYGAVMQDDGRIFTKYDLAKNSSIGVRRFNEIVKKSRNKLIEKTNSYA